MRAETAMAQEDDPYIWLEEVKGERALDWVRARNKESLAILEGDARFETFREQALEIVAASDRIPYGRFYGGFVYNFWQDEDHVRGIIRRTSLESYKTDSPDWETVLDIDALAETEGENWVYKGVSCLAPDYMTCMIALSRGGKDAVVRREYDRKAKRFVEDGFIMPEAKGNVAWLDADHLLVASDFGEGSLTTSGYPRQVKVWRRGEPLEDAPLLFEGEAEDVLVQANIIETGDGFVPVVTRALSFFDYENFVLVPEGEGVGSLRKLPLPSHVVFDAIHSGNVVVTPQKDWDVNGTTIAKGTVVSFSLDDFLRHDALPPLKTVYAPDARSAVQSIAVTRSALMVSILSNVTSTIRDYRLENDAWVGRDVALPENGSAGIASAHPLNDVVFVNYESFLVPDTLYALSTEKRGYVPTAIKSAPERFDASGLVTRQLEAVSADGTKVPYFVVHRADLDLNGQHPTLLYGYGGFRISLDPSYGGTIGRMWLERGGVYALANIRGGGEFGPAWHEAALKTNRQRAYDDFLAVAEDLSARKITSPERLGVMGGSNGGLLVGVAFTQRPDLMNAVVCAVPLLDMIRYVDLPPGASWIGEYGDPDIAEERAAIEAYSPYQNLTPNADYPKVFFVTSTEDDRVHPGHARKMAARMAEQGHDFFYYENIEGGHAGSANQLQLAHRTALQYVYLSRQLMDR